MARTAGVDGGGDVQAGAGAEHHLAGHRCAGRSVTSSSTLIPGCASRRETSRTRPGRSRPTSSSSIGRGGPARGARRPLDHDAQAAGLELGERALEGRHPLGGQLDAQDAGELARQVSHPALQPVAAMSGDGVGH